MTDQSPSQAAEMDAGTFQARVQPWMMACFGAEIAADRLERNDRFIEEALELVQATGYAKARANQLVDYVYGRPQGDINQEVGGVMVTLAAHCLAHGVDMHEAGETELARIWTKVEQIREKQKTKPKGSALPIPAPASQAAALTPEVRAPVQGYSPGIPWEMHLRAYDAYCAKWGRQDALIDLKGRNCRGGFSVGELDMFIPGWRDELSERTALLKQIAALQQENERLRESFFAVADRWSEDGEHETLASDFRLGMQEALRNCADELRATLQAHSSQGGEANG